MQEELAKRVATIHAQAILETVRQLECPTEQKIQLIEAVQKRIKEEMKADPSG